MPTTDQLGQPLHRLLPSAAHQWLSDSRPRIFRQTWVEGPHQHSYGPAHHLVTVAEESPETDSFVKQLAAHVGELANRPVVSASKHGKNGLEAWEIANRHYREGEGAEPSALAIV